MDFSRIIGGLIKIFGNTDGTPIGNSVDALRVNLRDSSGSETGTSSSPLFVDFPQNADRTTLNQYNEALSVASGISTSLISYTVPVDKKVVLERVSVSGENIALFTLSVNSSVIDKKRTFFGGELNTEFNFNSNANVGFVLNAGDTVEVTVLHDRPSVADFESRIQFTELT